MAKVIHLKTKKQLLIKKALKSFDLIKYTLQKYV